MLTILLFVYPNRGAVPDALIIQQRMKERMGSIVRAKEGYVFVHSFRYKLFLLARVLRLRLCVSDGVFLSLSWTDSPFTFDRWYQTSESTLVSFGLVQDSLWKCNFHIFFNFCFCSSSSVSASTSQPRPVAFSSPCFPSTGLTVVSLSCELFCPFEHRGSSVSIFFIVGFDLEFPSSFIFIFTSYRLFSFSISFRQSGCLISCHETQGATSSEHPTTLVVIH